VFLENCNSSVITVFLCFFGLVILSENCYHQQLINTVNSKILCTPIIFEFGHGSIHDGNEL